MTPEKIRSNPLRALWVLVVLFCGTITIFSLHLLERLFHRTPAARRAASLRWSGRWGRMLCRVADYHIHVSGAPPKGALLAANHQTYADIFALLAVGQCFFVPKGEIASWPLAGWLVRGTDQIFSSRRRGRDLRGTAQAIGAALQDGQAVCVFLEGTTSPGDRLLPFRSSFLQPALDVGAPILPVAIEWSHPDDRVDLTEDLAYWRPEHVFLLHLWRHLGIRGFRVQIAFGEPLETNGLDRKQAATILRNHIFDMRQLQDMEVEKPEDF